MTGRTNASPSAMRAALEQRLLARIAAEAPAGSWALKGGIAMIARGGERARACRYVE